MQKYLVFYFIALFKAFYMWITQAIFETIPVRYTFYVA